MGQSVQLRKAQLPCSETSKVQLVLVSSFVLSRSRLTALSPRVDRYSVYILCTGVDALWRIDYLYLSPAPPSTRDLEYKIQVSKYFK